MSGLVAFAVPSRYPAVICTVPCFDESMLFNGQMRLPLRLPVLVPEERSRFLARLIERSGQPVMLRPGIFTEPVILPFPVVPDAAPEPVGAKARRDREPVVTPLMLQVQRIVQRIATARQPMPNNPVLGEQAGGKGRGVVARALMRLDEAGRLKIEIEAGKRRVVMPDGAATGWGDFALGTHRPYSKRAKGAAPEKRPERPDYKPEGDEPFRYRIQPQRLVATGPSPTCQWPKWADGEKPSGTASVEQMALLFCGAASQSGHSYCKAHVADAYEPERSKAGRPRVAVHAAGHFGFARPGLGRR